MLACLIDRGFTFKCKSSIKLIKARIYAIRKKRSATQKIFKKDIADLLAFGDDIEAYRRAEGLLNELNRSSCYDIVEQFCDCILKHISVMQKRRECTEECKGAVQSLIFAAARFGDLPELLNLRKLFAKRYGYSLESFLNQEFAEKMEKKPPTREKKLQLMRDIAEESSVKWDSRAFEQKTSYPPASVQDRPKKQGSFHVPKRDTQDEYKSHSNKEDTVRKKDNQHTLSNGRREFSDDGYKVHNSRGHAILRSDKRDVPTRGRRELTDDGYKLWNERCNGGEDTLPENYNGNNPSHARMEVTQSFTTRQEVKTDVIDVPAADNIQNRPKKRLHSINKDIKEKTESLKPFCDNVAPPPYVKPRVSKNRTNSEAQETNNMSRGSKAPSTCDTAADTGRSNNPCHRSQGEAHLNTGLGHSSARAVSLPREPTAPNKRPRTPARASTFRPDGQAGHVHPRLPDYDDLAARFAALKRDVKGNCN